MHIKKSAILLFSALAISAGALFAMDSSNIFEKFAYADANSYSINLNSTNQPVISDSTGTLEYSAFATLNYTEASLAEGYHVVLGKGGTIYKTELAKGLSDVRIIFDGDLVFATYTDVDSYPEEYFITSGTTYTIGGNYFTIRALSTTRITSISLNYSCSTSDDTIESFQEKKDGSTWLGYYTSTRNDLEHNTNYFYAYDDDSTFNVPIIRNGGGMEAQNGHYYYMGDIDNFISFPIVASENQTAALSLLLHTYNNNNLSECIKVEVNNVVIDLSGITTPYTGNYDYYIGDVSLREGTNLITVSQLIEDADKATDIVAIGFANCTSRISWYSDSGNSASLTLEAEHTRWSSPYFNVNFDATQSGWSNYSFVGGINESGSFRPGQDYFVLNVYASKAMTAKLVYDLGASSTFDLSVMPASSNDVVFKTVGSTTGSGWYEFSEYEYGTIWLDAGYNDIYIYINNGAACNADYFKFNYDSNQGTLSFYGTQFERTGWDADDSNGLVERNGKCHGDDQLWRMETSGVQYIGRVNDVGVSASGTYWFEWNITASAACTARIYHRIATPGDYFPMNTLRVSVKQSSSSEYVEAPSLVTNKATNTGWTVFDEYFYGYVSLTAGTNVIRITIYDGAACNYEALHLSPTSNGVTLS